MMLGGDNILLSGPCFQPSHLIVCQFADGKLSNGSYIDENRASCTVPMLNITGRLPIKLSVNGGASFDFQGNLTIGIFCAYNKALNTRTMKKAKRVTFLAKSKGK